MVEYSHQKTHPIQMKKSQQKNPDHTQIPLLEQKMQFHAFQLDHVPSLSYLSIV